MSSWVIDLFKSIVEGILDIIDAFGRVSAATYLKTAIVILVVTLIAAFGPTV